MCIRDRPPGVPTGATAYVHVGALPLLHAASESPSASVSVSPALPRLPFMRTILPGLECPSLVGASVRRSGRSARSTSGPLTGVLAAPNIALSQLVLSRGSGGPCEMATSAATPGPGAARGTLAVMPAVTRFRLDRNADRRITAGGIAVAGGFVALSLIHI